MRKWLIVAVLVSLAGLSVLGVRRGGSVVPSGSEGSGSPAFHVVVVKPRVSRPLFGLVPSSFFGVPVEFRFDDASPGAEVVGVGHDSLELQAGGWDLSIETDGEGRIAPETRLVYSLELGGREQALRCRPSEPPRSPIDSLRERVGFAGKAPDGEDPATGYLEVREVSETVSGRFRLEVSTCKNEATGKTINWPPAPLVVSGSFERLPLSSR